MARKPVTITQESNGFWLCSLFWYREEYTGDFDTWMEAVEHAKKWLDKDIAKLQKARKELEEE